SSGFGKMVKESEEKGGVSQDVKEEEGKVVKEEEEKVEKSVEGSPVKGKELDGLCDAMKKVEVKGDEECAKPFKVVDDVEKEEYEKESTKSNGKKSVTSSPVKLPPITMKPSKKDYKIPREWANYSKCGEVVPTTPFLPFKSPLSEERFARHPELEEHTIISLIQDLSSRGIRLTTVIDLTLPFFYETEFLEAFDIRYEKIRIDNQEPRWHQVKRFLEICDDFAEQQAKRRREWETRQAERKAKGEEEEYYMYEVIGVHCTRGVNRTGYMICRAMIERMNYTAEAAVRLFNQARGHDMTEFMPELKAAEEKRRRNQYRGGGRGGRGGGERGRGGEGGRGRGGRGGGEYRGRGQ
ncbi:hypothetical protein PMAYCL1PPCAC_06049, partial [Pristionchus mayeri]